MLESVSIVLMLLLLVCIDKLAEMTMDRMDKKGKSDGIRRF